MAMPVYTLYLSPLFTIKVVALLPTKLLLLPANLATPRVMTVSSANTVLVDLEMVWSA